MKLNSQELGTIVHALRVAADRFRTDAVTALDAKHPRLAEQFDRQARDSYDLADKIEDSEMQFDLAR